MQRISQAVLDEMQWIRESHEAYTRQSRDHLAANQLITVGMPPPPPLDDFYGRRAFLEYLASLVEVEELKFISVVGPSGTGKTALVKKILYDLEMGVWPLDEAPPNVDGIVYLSTRTQGITLEQLFFNAAELLGGADENALLSLWGRSEVPIQRKIQGLWEAFEGRHVLFMLDNLEDKLDDKGRLTDPDLGRLFDQVRMFESQRRFRFLITSRIPLQLSTRRYKDHEAMTLDGFTRDEALAILKHHHFIDSSGDDDDSDELDTLINLVQGSPRGLELCISIKHHQPHITIADLTSLIHSAAQHPTEIIANHHYQSLTLNEQTVMQLLAVFDRPVPTVAVEYAAQKLSLSLNIAETLRQLREALSITYETSFLYGQRIRTVSLHTIDRDIAAATIQNQERFHKVAADYYREMRLSSPWYHIRQLEPHLLELKHLSFTTASEDALAVLDEISYSPKNQHKFLAALMALGYGNEAIQQREALDTRLHGAKKALNLTSLAWTCRRMNQKDKAERYFEAAIESAEQSGVWLAQVYAHSEYGYWLTDNVGGRGQDALKHLRIALNLAVEQQANYWLGHIHLGLAFVAFQANDYESSVDHTQRSIKYFKSEGAKLARYREIDGLIRLSMTYRKHGLPEKADEEALKALQVAQDYQLVDWEAEAHAAQAFNARLVGKFGLAIEEHRKAIRLFARQRGMRREEAVQQSYLGNLYLDINQLINAQEAYEEALRISLEVGLVRETSWIKGCFGLLFGRQGQFERAIDLQAEAIEVVVRNSHYDSAVVRYTDLAETYLWKRDADLCQTQLNAALSMARRDTGENKELDSLLIAYTSLRPLADKLPHEMQSPGLDLRIGILLTLSYLLKSDFASAKIAIERACQNQLGIHQPEGRSLSALVALLNGDKEKAKSDSQHALTSAEIVLENEPMFIFAHYARALAMLIMRLCEDHPDNNAVDQGLELAVTIYRGIHHKSQRGVQALASRIIHLINQYRHLAKG